MRLGNEIHLTYCLNIHPGESWEEQFRAMREKSLRVKQQVSPGEPFGLGLRLSHQAAVELSESGPRNEAREFFAENGLYAFTINGFPYGRFHGSRVKENVYRPDWQTTERRDYTKLLADILADLLPEGVAGSISTAPGSFKEWITGESNVEAMVERLCECALHLHLIEERGGKEIHLGLEPEPACYLERTEETVCFFRDVFFYKGKRRLAAMLGCEAVRAEEILRRHIGICFDTCHCAVAFEDPAESLRRYAAEGIRLSKIQISAALAARENADSREELRRFAEPVYLHQVRALDRDGRIREWLDLAEYFDAPLEQERQVRIHFHVPLFAETFGVLSSTRATLSDAAFFEMRRSAHWEIETYTFDVLPEAVRPSDVTESIAREFRWVLERVSRGG